MTRHSHLLLRSCYLVLLFPALVLAANAAPMGNAQASAPAIVSAGAPANVLITAVYYDPPLTGEASEAVQIQNMNDAPLSIAGWSLADDHGQVTFPAGSALGKHQKLWAGKSASAFRLEFGEPPAFEYGGNSDSAVPDLQGTALSLGNDGDNLVLRDDKGAVVDAVAYEQGSLGAPEWTGPPVQPFLISGGATEGQILFRKMAEDNGLPVPDTNSASDWAQDANDSYSGKRILLPGWDLDEFFQPLKVREFAHIKYCVAPDNIFDCYKDEILAAHDSIDIEAYVLNNAELVDIFAQRIKEGIRFRALFDADALDDQGRWACQRIEAAGAECWLIDAKPQANIVKRYDNLHAKLTVIDGKRVVIGSENLGSDGMPFDAKADGTMGTRGGALVTDSPGLVARTVEILNHDLDPLNHRDIRRWGSSANDYPPLDFVPNYATGGVGYALRFPSPLSTQGVLSSELIQCPENCLRRQDALLGLIGRADSGDTLLVEQLYERTYWGMGNGNPVRDPNLRLEAYIQAARRGAHVQVLLDSFYDTFADTRSNFETCRYINGLSVYYSIECRLGNPTGLGMHNKMVLLQHGPTGYVHLGSMNGSETSAKLNREVAVDVESPAAYEYWAKVFAYDWSVSNLSPRLIRLPIIFKR